MRDSLTPHSPFWSQPAAERALTGARDSARLSRSYLFVGPDGVGKWAAAMWVAKCILCYETASGSRPCAGAPPEGWEESFALRGHEAHEDLTLGVRSLRNRRSELVRRSADEKIPPFGLGTRHRFPEAPRPPLNVIANLEPSPVRLECRGWICVM